MFCLLAGDEEPFSSATRRIEVASLPIKNSDEGVLLKLAFKHDHED